MALLRTGVAAAILLLLAVGQYVAGAHAANGFPVNETSLVGELRGLIAFVANDTVSVEEARAVFSGIASCARGGAAEAAAAIASRLAEGNVSGARSAMDRFLVEIAREPWLLEGCSQDLVYRGAVAALATPTPLGLLRLPPNQTLVERVTELLAEAISRRAGVRVDPGWLQPCLTGDGLPILLAAIASDPATGEESIALRGLGRSVEPLCRVVAAGFEPPSSLALRHARLSAWLLLESTLDTVAGYWPATAAEAFEVLRNTSVNPLLLLGFTNLLEGYTYNYTGIVSRLLCGSTASLTPGPWEERLALAAGAGGRACEPLLEALSTRVQPSPPGHSSSSIYCSGFTAVLQRVSSGLSAVELEVLGSLASFCAAASGSVEPVTTLLRYNPLTPLDPGPFSAAGIRLLEGAAWASWSGGVVLAQRVSKGEALGLLGRLGFRSVEEAVRAGVELSPLLEKVSAAARSGELEDALQVLGYASRAASLRVGPSGGLYIYYASSRVVGWALLRLARSNSVPLVSLDDRTPLDIAGSAVFTVPGRQQLVLWALGLQATLSPPDSSPATHSTIPSHNATSTGGEEPSGVDSAGNASLGGVQWQSLAGLGGFNASSVASLLRQTASMVEAVGGEDEVADLLREAAAAIERGDYATGIALLEKVRARLGAAVPPELMATIVRRVAEEAGLTPEELAERIAGILANTSATGAARVNLSKIVAGIAPIPSMAAGSGAGGDGGGEFGEAAAEIAAESLVKAAKSGARVVIVENPEALIGLLNVSSLLGVAIDVTGRVSGGEAVEGAGASSLPTTGFRGRGLPRATVLAVFTVSAVLLLVLTRAGQITRVTALRAARARVSRAMRGGDARETFSQVLEALERVYGKRGPGETHREYARRLRGRIRDAYWSIALAYEEAWFGGRSGAVERVRRGVERLWRLLLSSEGGRG